MTRPLARYIVVCEDCGVEAGVPTTYPQARMIAEWMNATEQYSICKYVVRWLRVT